MGLSYLLFKMWFYFAGCDSASVEDHSSSEGELYDSEVSCAHSYIANTHTQPVSVSSLIATMDS
jgi:hypothetical protein